MGTQGDIWIFSASSQDGSQGHNGTIGTGSNLIQCGSDGTQFYSCFWRVRLDNVPQGTSIGQAYLNFFAGGDWPDQWSPKFYVEDVDNSAEWGAENLITDRAWWSTYVTWNTTAWSEGDYIASVNMYPLIDHVVNKAGWTPGNWITLRLSPGGDKSEAGGFDIRSYDYYGAKNGWYGFSALWTGTTAYSSPELVTEPMTADGSVTLETGDTASGDVESEPMTAAGAVKRDVPAAGDVESAAMDMAGVLARWPYAFADLESEPMTAAGAAKRTLDTSPSLDAPALSIGASGEVARPVTAALETEPMTAEGLSGRGWDASGDVTTEGMTISGAVLHVFPASASLDMGVMTAEGAANIGEYAAGAVDMGAMTCDGVTGASITASTPHSANMPEMTVDGAAATTRKTSAALELGIEIEGSASPERKATSTLDMPGIDVSGGAVKYTTIPASSALDAAAMRADGSTRQNTIITGAGEATAPAMRADGVEVKTSWATGASDLSTAAMRADGATNQTTIVTVTGELTTGEMIAFGRPGHQILIVASGDPTTGAMGCDGAVKRTVPAGAASLENDGMTIDTAATVTRKANAQLTTEGIEVSPVSQVLAYMPSSGEMSTGAFTCDGSGSVFELHTTSAILASEGMTIDAVSVRTSNARSAAELPGFTLDASVKKAVAGAGVVTLGAMEIVGASIRAGDIVGAMSMPSMLMKSRVAGGADYQWYIVRKILTGYDGCPVRHAELEPCRAPLRRKPPT